jgi:hypothetical protein
VVLTVALGVVLVVLGVAVCLWQFALLTNQRGVRDRYLDWVTRSQARARFMSRADRARIDYAAERGRTLPFLILQGVMFLIVAVLMLWSGVTMLIG